MRSFGLQPTTPRELQKALLPDRVIVVWLWGKPCNGLTAPNAE